MYSPDKIQKKYKTKLINIATTQKWWYSNLCILTKTKYFIIIWTKYLSETKCFNGAIGMI